MSIWSLVCPCKTKKKRKLDKWKKKGMIDLKNRTVSEKHAFKKPGGDPAKT